MDEKSAITIPQVGDHIEDVLTLAESDIVDGANFVRDLNPIHISADHNNSKISGLIASGSHVTGIFSAFIPTYFSRFGDALGLEMKFKFLAPVLPDVQYNMNWEIMSKRWSDKLGGDIFQLDGLIENAEAGSVIEGCAVVVFFNPR